MQGLGELIRTLSTACSCKFLYVVFIVFVVVRPLDWLVDKRVLGHNSAAGKGIPHANQRAGLVTLGKEGL